MKFSGTTITAAAISAALTLTATQTFAGAPPPGVDITGSWTGQIKCKGIDYDGDKFKDTQTGTILISTDVTFPAAFAVDTTGLQFDNLRGITTEAARCGETVELGEGKGQAVIGPFGVNDIVAMEADDVDFSAVYLKTVQIFPVKSDGTTGLLKGKSTLLPFKGALGECKWKFSRTNDVDPLVNTAGCFDVGFLRGQ